MYPRRKLLYLLLQRLIKNPLGIQARKINATLYTHTFQGVTITLDTIGIVDHVSGLLIKNLDTRI